MSTPEPLTWTEQIDIINNEQRAIWRKYKNFYQLLGGAIIVAAFVLLGVLIISNDHLPDYLINVYVAVVGSIATVVVLDRRNELRAIQQRKADLIYRLGSQVNQEARRAAEEIRKFDYHLDGSLVAANLREANLSKARLDDAILCNADLTEAILRGARLTKADLSNATLINARLQKAKLMQAVLRGAKLGGARLQGADLHSACLQNARLHGAHLEPKGSTATNLYGVCFENAVLMYANLSRAHMRHANLRGADLRATDLRGSNLLDADLEGAWIAPDNIIYIGIPGPTKFDETTILPDSSNWHKYTDMRRFTDSSHPNFWRPERRLPFIRQFYVGVELEFPEPTTKYPGIYQVDGFQPDSTLPTSMFMTLDNSEVIVTWRNGTPLNEEQLQYVYYNVARNLGLIDASGRSIPRERQTIVEAALKRRQ